MNNPQAIYINPKTPYPQYGAIALFLGLALMLLLSPYLDIMVGFTALFLIALVLILLWSIDYYYLYIVLTEKSINLKGYFSIRRIELHHSDIEGFEKREKIDQLNGLHTEIRLITKNRKKIIFSRLAYSDYRSLAGLIEGDFNLIGSKEIKHAKTWAIIMRIVWTLSGLFALLVAVKKII
jgi:hypothetical protein